MSDHKWHVFKWTGLWVAKFGHRTFEAATFDEAIRFATDPKRDEVF